MNSIQKQLTDLLKDKKVYYLPYREKSEFPLYTFVALKRRTRIWNWILNLI